MKYWRNISVWQKTLRFSEATKCLDTVPSHLRDANMLLRRESRSGQAVNTSDSWLSGLVTRMAGVEARVQNFHGIEVCGYKTVTEQNYLAYVATTSTANWYQLVGFWNLPCTHTRCIVFPFFRFTDLTQQYSSSNCRSAEQRANVNQCLLIC